MKPIWILSINTFREIIRDRILYGLMFFAILLIGISMLLGQLSFAEQVRISMNFGMTAIHLGTVILSIFVGSTLVAKEIEKKTIFTILTRPISRTQFIIGKSLGLVLVNIVVVASLVFVLLGVLHFFGADLTASFWVAIWGILLEGIILLGITLFFSSFSSSFLVVSFTLGVFLIGHWTSSLKFFAEEGGSTSLLIFQQIVSRVIPDLELLNWRSQAVYGDVIAHSEVIFASMYSLSWFAVTVVLTGLILRKKDFA